MSSKYHSNIQSILIHKTIDSHDGTLKISKNKASKYVKSIGFKPIKKVHETKNYYRFRIRDPKYFDHFIIKPINDVMSFVIGFY